MICTYLVALHCTVYTVFWNSKQKHISFHKILVLFEWSVQVHKRVGVQIAVVMHIKKGFLHFTWFIFLLWNIIMEPWSSTLLAAINNKRSVAVVARLKERQFIRSSFFLRLFNKVVDWNSSGGAVAGKLVKRYVGEKVESYTFFLFFSVFV